MSVHPCWRFSRAAMQGASEREEWYCEDCSRKVVCTSYRGRRSSEELTKPCRCKSRKK